jgi:hypothetical protein
VTHDSTHDDRLLQVAFDGAAPGGDVLERLARCDDCLTLLARALEDAVVLGPPAGARAQRLSAVLEEALVWRAVLEDTEAVPAEVTVERQKGE